LEVLDIHEFPVPSHSEAPELTGQSQCQAPRFHLQLFLCTGL
jgi:hypothetical protein